MNPDPPDSADDRASAAKARLVRMYGEIAATYGTALDLLDVFGRDLVAAARIEPGNRVLDIACGRGACLRPAAHAVGDTGYVLGIDLSPEMVALLSRDLHRDGVTNAEAAVGDAERLDFADASFDVITCGFGVHHFPHLPAALSASRRVLRDGGRFAASTFSDGTLDYPWVLAALAAIGPATPSNGRSQPAPMMTAPTLVQQLAEAGFDPVATTTTQHRFVFADVRAYMTWVRTQGLGTVINRLGASEVARFEHECELRLRDHRVEDGYELVKSVDITVGDAP